MERIPDMPWWALYGALAVATIIAARQADRAFYVAGLSGASAILALSLVVSNFVIWVFPDYTVPIFGSIDIAMATYFLSVRRAWSVALVILLALEIGEHFRLMFGEIETRQYHAFLNVDYFSQLCCVLLPSLTVLLERLRDRTAPAS